MNHIELGKEGEQLAQNYLLAHKMKLLEANYRWKRQEIDLIFTDNKELVFVEVKTRRHTSYGAPEAAVSRTKQRHLLKAANAFIQEKGFDLDARFDVVSIIHNNYETKIDHIKNAFYPTL
jgi:putative endonuclease